MKHPILLEFERTYLQLQSKWKISGRNASSKKADKMIIGMDDEDLEDVFGKFTIKLLTLPNERLDEIENLPNFVIRSCYNLMLDEIRKKKSEMSKVDACKSDYNFDYEIELQDEGHSLDGIDFTQEEREILNSVMEGLSQKKIAELRGVSVKRIAKIIRNTRLKIIAKNG